jgi:catechol 2,3-dioxygenase-like lactoylglutathione lyase family enzyme
MPAHLPEPWLAQCAFSVADMPRQVQFACDVLGFRRSNGLIGLGEGLSRIQGLPEPGAAVLWWVIDRQPFSQLEFWQYSRPRPRPRRDDWRPSDVGYVRVTLHIDDFDAALARLRGAGIVPLAPVFGTPGDRRLAFRDYEGLLFELIERDVTTRALQPVRWPGVPVAIRAVSLSVPDIERARRFWCDGIGCTELPGFALHTPAMEAVWALDGARREALVVRAGDLFIEILQYEEPAPRPWRPGYVLNDLGFLNVAMGYRSRDHLLDTYENLLAMGYAANVTPGRRGPFSSTYVTDDQGFSVELFYNEPELDSLLGFEPERTFRDIEVPGNPW